MPEKSGKEKQGTMRSQPNTGWRVFLDRRGALAVTSGLLLSLSFPPVELGVLAFGALVPLLFALDGTDGAGGAWLGLVSGTTFFLGSLPWVVYTMVTYGHLPWPIGVLVLTILASYLGLFVGLFGHLISRLGLCSGWSRLWAVPAIWVATEYARGHLLTGFPWNLLGYSQFPFLPVIQIASATGVYGISFLVVMVNVGIVAACDATQGTRGRLLAAGIPVLLLGVTAGWGAWQLAQPLERTSGLTVALVQGNIDQQLKWDPAFQDETLTLYGGLTQQAAAGGSGLVVWPETALPFFLREDAAPRGQVQALVKTLELPLLVGSPDRNRTELQQLYNSAFLLSATGEIEEEYRKIHLVPFGEYVPLQSVLSFVQKMAAGIGDFHPGERYTVFQIPGGRFGVLICYEAIFPSMARRFVREGAGFLVNITNDAWFGRSGAPAQHLAMAAFRALENGVWLVRAANTGISAIIDPYGRMVKNVPLFERGWISHPIGVHARPTMYTRVGDLFVWACLLASLCSVWMGMTGRHTSR